MVKILLDTGIGEIVELEKQDFGQEETIQHVLDEYLRKFDDPSHFQVAQCSCQGDKIALDTVIIAEYGEISVKLKTDEIQLKYQFENCDITWEGIVYCGQTDSLIKVLRRKVKENGHPEHFQVKSFGEEVPGEFEPITDIENDAIWNGGCYDVVLEQASIELELPRHIKSQIYPQTEVDEMKSLYLHSDVPGNEAIAAKLQECLNLLQAQNGNNLHLPEGPNQSEDKGMKKSA